MNRNIIGIDFGTTNSAVAINSGQNTEVIESDEFNSTGKVLRSIIYFDEQRNVFVGQEAIFRYIENGAVGRFMQSIKTFLPSETFETTQVYGKKYSLEDLIALILKKLKNAAEKNLKEGADSVVLGRPAIFSDDSGRDKLAEQRLRSAAKKAGFTNVYFQFEPIAAALAFERGLQDSKELKVLVGDFGGGTSDFAVIKIRGGPLMPKRNRKKDILSMGGVYVGGDLFDSQIMWNKIAKFFGRGALIKDIKGQAVEVPAYLLKNICQWHLIPQLRKRRTREFIRRLKYAAVEKGPIENLDHLIEDNYGFMLFQSIEKGKVDLSFDEISRIIFKERSLVIDESITRIEFEEMISADIEKIRKCLESVIFDAGLSSHDIDAVITTGGSSLVPCIRRIFINKFGPEKLKSDDLFTSVAHGLGVEAAAYI